MRGVISASGSVCRELLFPQDRDSGGIAGGNGDCREAVGRGERGE